MTRAAPIAAAASRNAVCGSTHCAMPYARSVVSTRSLASTTLPAARIARASASSSSGSAPGASKTMSRTMARAPPRASWSIRRACQPRGHGHGRPSSVADGSSMATITTPTAPFGSPCRLQQPVVRGPFEPLHRVRRREADACERPERGDHQPRPEVDRPGVWENEPGETMSRTCQGAVAHDQAFRSATGASPAAGGPAAAVPPTPARSRSGSPGRTCW